MNANIKAYLDAVYSDEDDFSRYYMTQAKYYELVRVGLIKQGPVVREIGIPELNDSAPEAAAAP